ncbi:MAG: hypothetical protein ACI35V_04620 [Sphingobacterium composti]|uniref:hypothetical protein n=1 Tax=Sphingobacterium composti TaxID=363260 RepID=UPI0013588A1E|nr:hypothetical protein [Sphingobacterium composti Ten et al. 2007 non Yoo et al. 2007]
MNKIPEQVVGKSLDYSRELNFPDETKAYNRYRQIVKKLLDVNAWQETAIGVSAEFVIVNEKKEIQMRRVKKNDFIRIDIPGPGTPSADGYDYVRVMALDQYDHQDKRKTFISLQPSPDPTTLDDDAAHFFKKYTSSNIVIKQEGNMVSLQYAGRNEVINTETDHVLDNVRNFLVGLGAKLGASYPQWKALIDGLAK